MSMNLVVLLYLAASVCFIQALKGLSHPTTSIRGNLFGMIGMAIAVLTTAALIVAYWAGNLTLNLYALAGVRRGFGSLQLRRYRPHPERLLQRARRSLQPQVLLRRGQHDARRGLGLRAPHLDLVARPHARVRALAAVEVRPHLVPVPPRRRLGIHRRTGFEEVGVLDSVE